jgi:DNA repair exonuclease SbcCD ATPase subunit
MPHRIKELKLTHFRGATQPVTIQFDPKKSVVVIFGENGTGKSTVVDAIDAVGNASFGSLDREGVRPNPHKYVSSINRTARSLEVELTTAIGHTWKATISGKNVVVAAGTDGSFLPGILVLRRRELLKLIETQPAKRYEAIKSFIDVAEVDKAEAALRVDLVAVDKQFGNAKAARDQAQKSLHAFWEQEKQAHETEAEPLGWAEQRIAEDLTALESQASHLETLLSGIKTLLTATASWQQAHETRDDCTLKVEAAKAKLADTNRSEDTRRTDLIGLLTSAKKYLAPPAAPTSCPLCANDVQAESLRQRIEDQLHQLQSASELLQLVNSTQNSYKRAADDCDRCNRDVFSQFRKLATHLATHEPSAVQALNINWKELTLELLTAAASDVISEQATDLAQQLWAESPVVQQALDSLRQRLTLHDNIKVQADLLKDSTKKAADLGQVVERLTKTCQLVVDTRREFVQTILDGIIEEVNRLFAAIHPGEKIGLHRLEMDDVKRSSLEQHARFEDASEVIPQAYFSESHLDTFGFCLWLALAKRLNPKQLVLVLDDVFTSVDTQHFQRISELLADEAQYFQQLIIATHNRRWHDLYRQNSAGAHLIKLESWTLNKGLKPYEDQTLMAALADALGAEPFDRQAVASQAGIVLETVLDRLALAYGCLLPHKHGNSYTLGELLFSTGKLLQKATIIRIDRDVHGHPVLPNNWSEIQLNDLFQTINGLTFIRNEVGAHFSPSGADLSNSDVRTFGEAVLAFAQALSCPTCGYLPQKERDDHRSCRCPKYQTQLRPLNRP